MISDNCMLIYTPPKTKTKPEKTALGTSINHQVFQGIVKLDVPPPTYPYGNSLCKPYTMYLWVMNHQGLGSILIFGCVSSHPVLVGIETSSIHRPSDHFLAWFGMISTLLRYSWLNKKRIYPDHPCMVVDLPTFG